MVTFYVSIPGMLKSITQSMEALRKLRSDDKFAKVINEVDEKMEISRLPCHRQRQPPTKFDGASTLYNTTDVKSRYRHMYYQLVDLMIT